MSDRINFVEVLATFNIGDLAFVKSLLDASAIRYYIEGENFCQIRPLVAPARIKVDETQLEEARDILKDFTGGTFGYQIGGDKS